MNLILVQDPPPLTPSRYLSIHACIWGHAAICSSKCIKSPKHFIETQCYGWHDITLFVHCEYVIKPVKMTYVSIPKQQQRYCTQANKRYERVRWMNGEVDK